ncbi:hypothetical protein ACHAXA_010401 [Cyclostephanos tholiformis]|uniref:Uncharacterized protein n=1 Tax=Cyclostephanos tholiformis TaxID=382380 RepID=A0ABD3SF19_9STRA
MMASSLTRKNKGGGGSGNKNLKLRRQHSAANPQDLDDVECCITGSTSSLDDNDKKDDDYVLGRRTAEFLSDLSPLSRRIVRFVTPTHPSLPDRCTSECLTVAAARILPSLAVLVVMPLLMWDSYPEDWGVLNPYPLLRHVDIVWSSCLHTSAWPIIVGTLLAAALMPRGGLGSSKSLQCGIRGGGQGGRASALLSTVAANVTQSNWKTSIVLSAFFNSLVIVNMTLQMGYPHAAWNPFMWGWYRVYLPENISASLQGACLDFEKHGASKRPLCLSEGQWSELSSGRLSSYNPDDVLAVQRGLDYLQNESGGIIINAIARNVADSIPALRSNIEGLVPFFGDDSTMGRLSLVVFENDSDDGTREMFQSWSDQEKRRVGGSRYAVDLMGCGPKNPNCDLGIEDRYDNMNLMTNPTASGVGKLGEFRQILMEYILKKDEYADYSHMVVLDADLGTSLSPLGLLHTLGLEKGISREHAVASASSQVWPGTMGTIIPPYDLSAFRPKETTSNEIVRRMHQSFCDLMPAGDRWRNMCEACSPMQLFMIQSANDVTSHHDRPYEVVSAFNGLTMYPMDLIRERGDQARYDAGDDGQRCEHVGFHLSLNTTMYVNPKWSMNLKPSKPGGPTGLRAIKTLVYAIFGRPNVMLCLVLGNLVFFYIVVSACWMIGTSVKRLFMLMFPRPQGKRFTENYGLAVVVDRDRRELFDASGIDTREM